MADRLSDLVLSATNSPAKELDEALLKAIKAVVRESDSNACAAAELLLNRLGKNHAQVRLLALLAIDELFMRSKAFRGRIVSAMERLLVLCLGFRVRQPLPPPPDRAALLKAKALEIVERWNEKFGSHYKELRLGYEYVKDTLRMVFPGVSEAASRAEEERNARERRTQDLLRCRLVQLADNFPGLRKDLESTLDQLEECFAILSENNAELRKLDDDRREGEDSVPKLDGALESDEKNDESDEEEDEGEEVFGLQSLRSMREHEEMMVTESGDNEVIFAMARDLLKLVATRHLPAAQEWLSVLMRVDPEGPEDRQGRDVLMKDVIDLRNRMLALRDKCQEIGIVEAIKPKTSNEEDDLDWEDEQVFDKSKLNDRPRQDPEQNQEQALPPSASRPSPVSELKKQLLEEAPLLPWGSFLDAWGSSSAVPANTRGIVLDNHWGRVDPDALISSDKMAEMAVRASYYQPPTQSDTRPCLAPLRNGGLCQRRDLRKCPLHGTVIPRDDRGNPIGSGPRGVKTVVSPAAVAAQAVKNVRDRDKQKKRLRQNQARIDREHNEAVLRTAALARDPETIAANVDDRVAEGSTAASKKRRGGLSAMLRKKETAKDRIGRRLLHGRAVDATIASISHAEDAKYRESFPNQW